MAASDSDKPPRPDPIERARIRLAEPDGIVFRSDLEIIETIKPFVVALTGPAGLGSGFLVRLWERFFILTAGHVVRDIERTSGPVRLVIANEIHDARFDLPQRRFVCDGDADFGFFELHSHDAARVSARDKLFANSKWIHVAESLGDDDLYVASGFPAARMTGAEQQQWLQFCYWLTSAAGTRKVPPSIGPNPNNVRVVDLCVDEKVGVALEARTRDEPPDSMRLKNNIDPMPGVSGGPCWRAFVTNDAQGWTPRNLRLVATHRGRLTVEHDGKPYAFARQVGIGHHLALIKATYPDLSDRILETWPAVADYEAGA